jgi:hypothetical protein
MWLSPAERSAAEAKDSARREALERRKRNVVTFDFAGRRIVEVPEGVVTDEPGSEVSRVADGTKGTGVIPNIQSNKSDEKSQLYAQGSGVFVNRILFGEAGKIYENVKSRLAERYRAASKKEKGTAAHEEVTSG